MNADLSSKRLGLDRHPLCGLLLLGIVVVTAFAASATAEQPGPASQPAPAMSDKIQPEKTIIIERHFMPQAEMDEAYRRGMQEGYAQGQLDATHNARIEQLLHTRDDALKAGLEAFSQGQYDQAADCFLLGTELDHGDPATRIHAAQALFALEQYQEAVSLIRRALELQPRLLYQKFDLRRDYGDVSDLQQQIDSLNRYLAANPNWQDGYFLLGYQLLYSGQRTAAHMALNRAVSLNPTDKLATNLYKASTPLPQRSVPHMQPAVRPAISKHNRT